MNVSLWIVPPHGPHPFIHKILMFCCPSRLNVLNHHFATARQLWGCFRLMRWTGPWKEFGCPGSNNRVYPPIFAPAARCTLETQLKLKYAFISHQKRRPEVHETWCVLRTNHFCPGQLGDEAVDSSRHKFQGMFLHLPCGSCCWARLALLGSIWASDRKSQGENPSGAEG